MDTCSLKRNSLRTTRKNEEKELVGTAEEGGGDLYSMMHHSLKMAGKEPGAGEKTTDWWQHWAECIATGMAEAHNVHMGG